MLSSSREFTSGREFNLSFDKLWNGGYLCRTHARKSRDRRAPCQDESQQMGPDEVATRRDSDSMNKAKR